MDGGTRSRLRRLKKLLVQSLNPQRVGIAVHQALNEGELPAEGTAMGDAVRDVLNALAAIEVVQEGVDEEWVEADEKFSLNRASQHPD